MLSIVAVGFVTWMVMWMARSARSLSGELKGRVDGAADAGGVSLVRRRDAGRRPRGPRDRAVPLGRDPGRRRRSAAPRPARCSAPRSASLTAVVLGFLFYKGAVKINLRKFFTWTGAILIVVAAGVLAYGVHDLQEAGILPGLNNLAFDVSDAIAPGSCRRHAAQGHPQLLPRDHLARGRRLGGLRRRRR